MKYWITFFGEGEDPIKITEQEYAIIQKTINQAKFIFIRGEGIAVSSIKRIKPIQAELPGLPPPQEGKPLTKDFLNKHKQAIASRFSVA